MRTFQLLGVKFPKITLLLGLLLMGALASGLAKLYKDTRADAFLEADNPALVYKDKTKEIFGINDPIVIAVEDLSPDGIYRPQTLALIGELSEAVNELDNIDEERTLSLATEDNIVGTSSGMDVTPFYELLDEEGPAALREAIKAFPLYDGLLVAEDGRMALVIAEMIDEDKGEETYQQINQIISAVQSDESTRIHVAGEGAVLGFLGSYIDGDAGKLNPLAGLIITIMLIVAFRRFAPALLGNVVIAAAALMTLGFMAYCDVPFFVITNAMPVILIGIAVADSIHIFSHYYEYQAKNPQASPREAIEASVQTMFVPITLTTVTTIAGFMGLYLGSYMPPFEYFGLFAAFGVFIAWMYSLWLLPAAICLMKPKVSKSWIALEEKSHSDAFAKVMMFVGKFATTRLKTTVIVFGVLAAVGATLTTKLEVNENRINTFDPSEPIYQADAAINRYMEGSNTLDVVIETPVKEGLFSPKVLQQIQALQNFAETQPHVNGSVSIVDYLKQMHQALNENRSDYYALPDTADLVAQYFLLYSTSGDPTAFEHVVDYDYRLANVRFYLDSADFQATKPSVQALQNYIDNNFTDADAKATLTGRVNVSYHWIKDLGQSHFLSVAIAMAFVLLVSIALFRSVAAGLLAVTPVMCSILCVYAAMVVLGIDLGIGTSMFASVAIGLGVDFAIHTIDRLKTLTRSGVTSAADLVQKLYASTGRALFFNYLAIAFGFGVLMISKVVPLNNFGTIVVLSVSVSFISAMMLIPALVLLLRPAFFFGAGERSAPSLQSVAGGLALLFAVGLAGYSVQSDASETNSTSTELSALDIVERINRVEEGEFALSDLNMTLVDKRGKVRTRQAKTYRKYYGEEKRTLFFYEYPKNVEGTSFLTYDYPEFDKDDDQWLYLPALRKVRRISASDRGDYFLGTDFTYEDIKQSGKLEERDYHFSLMGDDSITIGDTAVTTIKLEALPRNDDIAKELGYGKLWIWVSPSNWVVQKVEYWDRKERPLKTYTASDIRQVDGIWTRHKITVDNHKTGHQSTFEFSNVDYQTPVEDRLFTRSTMERGL